MQEKHIMGPYEGFLNLKGTQYKSPVQKTTPPINSYNIFILAHYLADDIQTLH